MAALKNRCMMCCGTGFKVKRADVWYLPWTWSTFRRIKCTNCGGTGKVKPLYDVYIDFVGLRGKGTTTTAILVGRILRSLGMIVTFQGRDEAFTKHMRSAALELQPFDISQQRSVLISDRSTIIIEE